MGGREHGFVVGSSFPLNALAVVHGRQIKLLESSRSSMRRDKLASVDFRRGSASQSCAGPQAIDATSRTDPKIVDLLPGHQLSG
jgi:hypothetical protein